MSVEKRNGIFPGVQLTSRRERRDDTAARANQLANEKGQDFSQQSGLCERRITTRKNHEGCSEMTKKRVAAAVSAAVAAVAMVLLPATPAFAKIQPVDVSCTNQGGNQPGGQQPSCQGGGLTQDTENQNPAGQAPPGQNP
ncbi:hypothetical protein [Prauserella flavalba]|uniref:hypothetical protein n=1 Tax=Prauserella flavalba TaxID=1477506 RepID=UPI001AF021E5|nr:hypothetical protein [Prauserella flavalba]